MSSFVFKQPVSEEIFETKYMLHGEETVEEVLRGVAKEVASAEEVDKGFWEDTFYDLLVEGKFIPAGRILANARVDSPMKNYMNCFVLPIGDSIAEIYETITNSAKVAVAGGGVGVNVSRLRPKGAPISRGGESSGPLSFLDIMDTSAKAIHTGGGRRAATLAILNIDHPDIEEFITYKQGDNNKKLTQFNISVGITDEFMVAVKNDTDWDLQFEGKVYKTVKARYLYDSMTKNMFEHNEPGVFFLDTVNRNNNGCYMYDIESPNPCVTGDTLIMTERGEIPIIDLVGKETVIWNGYEWSTVTPEVTGKNQRVLDITFVGGKALSCTPYHTFILAGGKKVKAMDLQVGDKLQAWLDPFSPTYKVTAVIASIKQRDKVEEYVYCFNEPKNHTGVFNGVMTGQCGEQPLPPMGVCCLGSLKLSSFILNPYTDEAEFDWQEYRRAIHTSVRFLDNVLSVAEYPLPEIRERALAERRIGSGFTALADTFAMLGMRYGDDESLEFAERAGRELRDYSYTASIDLAEEKGHFSAYSDRIFESEFIQKLPAKIQDRIKQSGIRNIALNTVAPAGTISLSLGNNCSSGIEPIFATEYTRNVTQLDGSKIPQTVFNEAWLDYQTITGKTEVPDFFVTSAELPLEAHLKMQAVFQQYIDASISKTIQLPDEFSLDEYKNLILDAWSMGLKGITTFNPKGSLAPILTTEKVQKPIGNGRLAKKRPEKLPCDIHEMTVNKQRMVVLVGKDEETGQLYEVFVTADPENKLYFDKAKEGFIKKTRRGRYDLVTNGHILLENITEVFDNDYASMCRLVSLAMRHNIPLQFIVDQLNKTSRFDAFSKTMARVLKKYLNDGEKALTESTCPECGEEVIFVEGCKTCRSCGWSKC